jgi:hypothetical protein
MSDNSEMPQYQSRKKLAFGLIMIAVGSVFLLDRTDLLELDQLWHYWPALIALSGVIKIISASKTAHVIKGCMEIVIAFWLYASFEHLWGWSFHNSWPILLIALGVSMIARGFSKVE